MYTVYNGQKIQGWIVINMIFSLLVCYGIVSYYFPSISVVGLDSQGGFLTLIMVLNYASCFIAEMRAKAKFEKPTSEVIVKRTAWDEYVDTMLVPDLDFGSYIYQVMNLVTAALFVCAYINGFTMTQFWVILCAQFSVGLIIVAYNRDMGKRHQAIMERTSAQLLQENA